MDYLFSELKEAPIFRKVPPRTLPLEFCFLPERYYVFLTSHGLKDFAKVTAISCIRNKLSKGQNDYYITTITHKDTPDGNPASMAFYEYRRNLLDISHDADYGYGFESLRDLATRHGLPIAFYLESPNEQGELEQMNEAGIDWRLTHEEGN